MEENQDRGKNSTVNVEFIRGLRPRYAWMKTFVFLLTLDRESTDRCFLYAYYGDPHDSLSQRLSVPQPTRGSGSPKKWQPVTPAMAAGLTDHVWTMEELLSYRVPPDFRDRLEQQATNNTA